MELGNLSVLGVLLIWKKGQECSANGSDGLSALQNIYFSFSCWLKGSPVAQWVKRWPTDLAVPGWSLARGGFFSTVTGSIAHRLSLSFAHRPDMTKILLKTT